MHSIKQLHQICESKEMGLWTWAWALLLLTQAFGSTIVKIALKHQCTKTWHQNTKPQLAHWFEVLQAIALAAEWARAGCFFPVWIFCLNTWCLILRLSTSLDLCCSTCHSHFTLLHLAVLCSILLSSSQVTCLLSCFAMTVGRTYCETSCYLKIQANCRSICLICNFSHPLSSNATK